LTRYATALTLLGAMLVSVSGCGGQDDDLKVWAERARRAEEPKVPPLPEPLRFEPAPYTVASELDPFNPQKLASALAASASRPSALLAAELERRREPLEAYPLDAISMVGSVMKGGQRFALLKVDKLLYRAGLSEYMGPNYGKIVQISETEVVVREIVQDATGDWVERNSTLQLQEAGR
jgi:type IV pilus assembly protein PilP